MAVFDAAKAYGLRLSDMQEILPSKLYLSGLQPVQEATLKQHGISVVVRILDTPPSEMPGIDQHWFQIDDVESESGELRKHFDTAADIIDTALTNGKKVLVHCRAGVSRSATVVLCYLMKHHRMTLLEAHSHVQERRRLIRPNLGFWAQLVLYERSLFEENTVTMVSFKEGWAKIPDIYREQFNTLY